MLEILCELSRYYGSDPEFVLAGGGNTSFKTEDTLWIKASGAALANLKPENLVGLDRARLNDALVKTYSSDPFKREEEIKQDLLAARREPGKGQRPSVEALVHHLLDRVYVVHLHPCKVNGITCAINGESIVRHLWGDAALWAPYVDPGYCLSQDIAQRLKNAKITGSQPLILFLQNHGVFVATETADEMRSIYADMMNKVDAYYVERGVSTVFSASASEKTVPHTSSAYLMIGPILRGALAQNGVGPMVRTVTDPLLLALLGSDTGARLAQEGQVTPDGIVYCRSFPLWVEPTPGESQEELADRMLDATKQYEREHGCTLRLVFVPGIGAWVIAATPKEARVVEAVYQDTLKIMALAEGIGGCRFLDERERRFIETWEVEIYRHQVSTGRAAGRLAGKTAVVTGAAQGLGLGIAEGLVAEGAFVCVSDLNKGGAEAAATTLNRNYGEMKTFAKEVNVADGASVAALAEAVVREFGGIDLVISNAGILKSGSVTALTEAMFRQVTEVNYTGYFLCVKHFAPIMAAQRRRNSAYTSDIIQINSKSGLEGSNRNAAYAGGKFGGIGLTQSFALELVQDGIKVNAVCPGNYFDGPLWLDPVNGLFVQYLKAGKVPGAKSVEDVRRFYESKVPMGRGCTVADVLHAVFYLVEQQYETGQAVPVTGGQVMLH